MIGPIRTPAFGYAARRMYTQARALRLVCAVWKKQPAMTLASETSLTVSHTSSIQPQIGIPSTLQIRATTARPASQTATRPKRARGEGRGAVGAEAAVVIDA